MDRQAFDKKHNLYPAKWESDGKITIPKSEFYINHICNLNCKGCNRFNDHNFVGHQLWQDYEQDLRKWGEYILIDQIVIMGGEPLLNPTLKDWVLGLNSIWPQALQILSNGTRINRVKGLYDLVNFPVGNSDFHGPNWIGISLHNSDDFDLILNEVRQFLVEPIQETTDRSLLRNTGAEMQMIDANGVKVRFWQQNVFVQGAVVQGVNSRLTLRNNDPEMAHNSCAFAQFRCYHMIKGKIHKCGPVGIWPDFDDQFDLDLSPEDKQLIRQYEPLGVDEFETRAVDFFANIDNPIEQCKFCAINHYETPELIYPTIKGKTE